MDQPPSEMDIDQYQSADEPVHVITTPEDSVIDESEKREDEAISIRADDFDAIKATYMPPIQDLETLDESHHTWEIDNWRSHPRRDHGPTFKCADFPWRVLFFPSGNNVDYASFYLEHAFDEKPPEDWYACAQFLLVLWNPNDPRIFQQHTASHRFTADEGDWGFTRFAELRRLFDVKWETFDRPLVERESARLTAYVRVVKDPTGVLWHSFIGYDSKKETGMVGLKNQGATCYLNSLLQSLYFTTAFRKAVYQIITHIEESPRENSAYALQRLFLQLQTSENAVATNELTASFGWSSREIFEQQDIQELSRVLMERLEEKMKGSGAENALANMFMGKSKTYLDCINVPYTSSKIEDYWDIQLNVNKLSGLDESFQQYIDPEVMDGDNQYFAEGFGLQDAKKGVIFESFPSVLHLQLKRFEYDFHRDAMMKVNDRFEFPETWDASPYLSEHADKSEPYIYKLHGVLVHSGDLHAGHYYAFLKPHKDDGFFKFDDDRVTRATLKEAIDDNFGGEWPHINGGVARANTAKPVKRVNSAYMLVYIRECHLDRILLESETVEPPEAVSTKFAEEKALAEKRKKEKDEAHLYMEVTVATEENFTHHQGFDLVPISSNDLADEIARPTIVKIKKKTTIGEFVETFALSKELDPKVLRPWCMVNRQNGTTRPDQPILDSEMTVEEASAKYGHKNNLRLWMETAIAQDATGTAVFGDSATSIEAQKDGEKPIVLFLKYFDVDNQTLYGVGHFYALPTDKVSDLSPHILKLMKWPSGSAYRIYEEIKHNMIEPMKPKMTLLQAELQDGDIVTVQRVINESELPQIQRKFTEVREFYDYLLNRIMVRFAPKHNEGEDFTLALNKKLTYSDFARAVGEHLKVEPTFLRFCTVAYQTGRPKATIRHTINQNLGQILQPSYAPYSTQIRNDALYYEVLECSVAELEQRRAIKVTWLPEGQSKEDPYELLIQKTGTISDLISQLAAKASIPDAILPRVRIFEAHNHRTQKELAPTYPIVSLQDYAPLYADVRAEEELNLQEGDHICFGFSYDREPSKSHGYPFSFLLREGEQLSEARERIGKRVGVGKKVLEKIKFTVVQKNTYTKPVVIEDDDILSEKLGQNDLLGLDYQPRNRGILGRVDQIFIK